MLLYPVIIVVARTQQKGMFVQSALVAAAFGIGFAMYYSIEFLDFKLIPRGNRSAVLSVLRQLDTLSTLVIANHILCHRADHR